MKYDIRPVKAVDDNYERCEPDDPDAVWGLYEVGDDGLSTHVSDHASEAEAQEALNLIQKEQR